MRVQGAMGILPRKGEERGIEMAESLKTKTLKGTLWSGVERFSVQGIQFLVMIVMARVLTPEDYGLVGMLAIFIAISQSLVDSGFSQALIRKLDRTETDNSTVFYFNIAVAVCIYIILFLSAPLIADFYNEPELVSLTRVVCFSIVIDSPVVVQRALLTSRIDFRTQARATLPGAIISGIVGISLAYSGFGVWSIVAQQLTNVAVTAVLLWILSRWRPSFVYSWKTFKELFSFGSKLAASGIIERTYRYAYLIVIGKIFKAADLGYYTRAQQFADFPSSNLSSVIQRVTFPVLCSIQNDDEKLRSIFIRFLRITAFVVFTLMMGLAGVARPFINVILGEQWEYAGVLLQIICFSFMWYPVQAINLNLLQVKGRSDLFLKLEICKKIIGVLILVITIPYGLVAMCYGSIVTSIIELIINAFCTGKLINIGFLKQMRELLPTMAYSFSMFFIVLYVVNIVPGNIASLFAGIAVGMVYFFLITTCTHSRDIRELFALLKK